MSVKIRLARGGRKKSPSYSIIVSDSRSPRDGRFIEKIGTYNPKSSPAQITLNEEKALEWLLNGAQPTDTVKIILSRRGLLIRKHLQIGVIKKAITQEQADAKYAVWKQAYDAKATAKRAKMAQEADTQKQNRQNIELKGHAARVEKQQQKKQAASAEPAAETPQE